MAATAGVRTHLCRFKTLLAACGKHRPGTLGFSYVNVDHGAPYQKLNSHPKDIQAARPPLFVAIVTASHAPQGHLRPGVTSVCRRDHVAGHGAHGLADAGRLVG